MTINRKVLATITFVFCTVPICAQNGSNNSGQNSPNRSGQNSPGQNQDGGGYGYNRDGNNGNRNGGVDNQTDLPVGTRLRVRLDRSARNSQLRQGDVIQGTLVDDVSVNEQLVASSGSRVQLRVDATSNDSAAYRLDSMTSNGRLYRLVSDAVQSGDARNGSDDRHYNNGNDGNRSGAQQLGDLLSGSNDQNRNRQDNDARRRQDENGVLTFRLTSAARSHRIDRQ